MLYVLILKIVLLNAFAFLAALVIVPVMSPYCMDMSMFLFLLDVLCNEIAQTCCFSLSDERKSFSGKLHVLQELTKQIYLSQGLNTGLWNFLKGGYQISIA